MRSAEARACLLALGIGALLGCTRGEQARPAAPTLLSPTHYLDEPFVLGRARCRLLTAEPMLTEPVTAPPSDPQDALVAEDLSVVQARFHCEDEAGNALALSALGARVAWVDQQRSVHLPSSRTRLGQKEPEHPVFEVPSGREGLLRARSYDALAGEPVGTPAGSVAGGSARLYLEPQSGDERARAAARVVIAPWPRLHDATFDLFLDRLVRGLARPEGEHELTTLSENEAGHRALLLARSLYAQARSQLGSKLLSIHSLENVEGQARLTMSLAPRPGSSRPAETSLRFELARGAVGQPVVARLLDPHGSKLALECAARGADLKARAERAREDTQVAARCNVLGELLPGTCGELDAKLRAEALFVGTRCGADGALGLLLDDAVTPPADFEVKLRRGRSLAGLDQGSRYLTSITREGAVYFDGQHRVSTRGPSEGLTSATLLAALYDHVARLGFFERPAVEQRCAADDRGDLVSVRALGRERTVRDRDGCRGGFSTYELSELRRAIERVAAVDAWIAPDVPIFSRDAEIWVVAAE